MHLGTCATVGEKNITHVVSASVLLHRVQNGPRVSRSSGRWPQWKQCMCA